MKSHSQLFTWLIALSLAVISPLQSGWSQERQTEQEKLAARQALLTEVEKATIKRLLIRIKTSETASRGVIGEEATVLGRLKPFIFPQFVEFAKTNPGANVAEVDAAVHFSDNDRAMYILHYNPGAISNHVFALRGLKSILINRDRRLSDGELVILRSASDIFGALLDEYAKPAIQSEIVDNAAAHKANLAAQKAAADKISAAAVAELEMAARRAELEKPITDDLMQIERLTASLAKIEKAKTKGDLWRKNRDRVSAKLIEAKNSLKEHHKALSEFDETK